MDLKTFIDTSIRQIIDAVHDCGEYAKQRGAIVNPPLWPGEKVLRTGTRTAVSIDFDVAVTTVNAAEKDGDGSLRVMGIGLGGKVQSSNSTEAVSRVKFSVAVALPGDAPTKPGVTIVDHPKANAVQGRRCKA